ncbi:MAG: metal ABC transporter permease [Bacteroidota bacterium]
METLWDFISFQDPNVSWVVMGVTVICAASAVVGNFTFLSKRALLGDAISHAILPGVCVAFMLTHVKHPLVLFAGAIVSGWLGLMAINYLTRNTKLKSDAALGLVLSVFYGLGILLLTVIQSSGNAAQSGLDKFLFGKAAALLPEDVITFGVFSLLLVVMVVALYQPFKLVIFDREYALAKGLPVKLLDSLISLATVIAIALGIQAVGVVLMAALLIAPAAAARYWTDKLSRMIILSAVFAAISGWIGSFISYTIPKMPTGPWIVSVLSVFAIGSVLLGPKKGAMVKYWRHLRHRRKMLLENILKSMYQLGEKSVDFAGPRTILDLQNHRYFAPGQLMNGLNILQRKGMVSRSGNAYTLTQNGVNEGSRVVRIHRLWELYLTRYLQLPPDHVHDDAEAIEHVITPELERELTHRLAYPLQDPHDSPIPYVEDSGAQSGNDTK